MRTLFHQAALSLGVLQRTWVQTVRRTGKQSHQGWCHLPDNTRVGYTDHLLRCLSKLVPCIQFQAAATIEPRAREMPFQFFWRQFVLSQNRSPFTLQCHVTVSTILCLSSLDSTVLKLPCIASTQELHKLNKSLCLSIVPPSPPKNTT